MDPVTDATRGVEDAAARAQLAAQEEADRRARIEEAHSLASETARRVEDYESRLAESRARVEELGAWRDETAGERAVLAEQLGALEHRLASAEGRLGQLLSPPPAPPTPEPSPSETIVTVNEPPSPPASPSPPPHRGVRLLRRRA